MKKLASPPPEGFSLVELLVVICIITILAALLIASVQRAHATARSAKCLSNLRTMASGALTFIADRNGELLPAKFWNDSSAKAKPGFREYVGIMDTNTSVTAAEMKRDSVFTCPELKRRYPNKFPSYLNSTYSVNFYAYRYEPEDGTEIVGSPKVLSAIPKPSKMWMFTDAMSTSVNSSAFSAYITDGHARTNSSTVFAFPHSGRQNTVFFDGHVEALDQNQFFNPPSKLEFWGKLNATN